jgi:hypothetical protein
MKITDLNPVTYAIEKYYYENNKDRKENYEDGNSSGTSIGLISLVFFLLFGIYAFYLSWSCNTIQGYNFLAKIIFGLFAFLFNFQYLILYLIFRFPCKKCEVYASSP